MKLAVYMPLHAYLTAQHLQTFCVSLDMLLDVFLFTFLLFGTHYAAAQDGYATENGGVTGGAGGTTTTVSSAAAFETAISVSFTTTHTQEILLTVL